jgi:drug/metabolite transporter (DMT)-like permease
VIITLVLVSAALHALWNALLRLERDKDRALVLAVLVATVLAAIVAVLRWRTGDIPFPTWTAAGWALVAGTLEWAYFASLAQALGRGALGPVYTISRGGAIVLVWPLSIVAYGERLTVASAIGSMIVVAGLACASRSGPATPDRTADRSALAWSVVCAASIAGYHLSYKAALREGGSPSAVFALALLLASLINVVRLGSHGRSAARVLAAQRWHRLLLMGAICSSSFLLLMEALARGGSGYVLTLRNTSVLFATVLAFAIRERPTRAQVSGAVLVAAGAIAMAWP